MMCVWSMYVCRWRSDVCWCSCVRLNRSQTNPYDMPLIAWCFNTMYTSLQLVDHWGTPPHYSPTSERVHLLNIVIRSVDTPSWPSCPCLWVVESVQQVKEAKGVVASSNIYRSQIFNLSCFQMIQAHHLLLCVDVESRGFVSLLDDLESTVA